MSVNHIDISEFQRIGFLQEANRLFFHPHGLALEVTTVTDRDDPNTFSKLTLLDAELWTFSALIAAERDRRSEGTSTADLDALEHRVENAQRFEIGDAYLSGVWDVRGDPEGIYYGEWDKASTEKVEAVAKQRLQHFAARVEMFGLDPSGSLFDDLDVEPVGWVAPGEPTAEAS